MTSGGMLVRVNVPWEPRFVLRTECGSLVVVSFSVETVLAAEIRNTLWGVYVTGNEPKILGLPTHHIHRFARGL